ncbi:unnamed protein product, partial [Didymodactylos carnosus]
MSKVKDERYNYLSYTGVKEDEEIVERFRTRWSKVAPCDPHIDLDKFQLIRTLGRGSFGRVVLALLKVENAVKVGGGMEGNKFYAIKVMDKKKL